MESFHHMLHPVLIFAVVAVALNSLLGCEAQVFKRQFCSFFYYSSNSGCRLCKDRCPLGEGLVRNCGYDAYGRKIKPACAPCKDGFFSPRKNLFITNGPSSPCRLCRQCFPPSRTRRNCSPTRNAKCSRCPRGMYKQEDGHCYKCSYCCDGMIENNINVVAGCRRGNIKRCVCREGTICYDGNVYHNYKCPAYKRTSSIESSLVKVKI